jgi:hypothetical protein
VSQFVTEIAVDVDGVRRLLPRESFVESVTWNEITQRVEVVWSNRNCVTPYSIATPFTVQMLHDKEIPACAKMREFPAAPQTNSVTDSYKVLDVKRSRRKGGVN